MTLDQAARLYLGTPYRHQGRDPSIGIDCVGLVVLALEWIGHRVQDFTSYSTDPHHGLLERHLDATFSRVAEMRAGDIVSMDFMGAVRHVGIVGEDAQGLTLIHTTRSLKRVVEHHINSRWQKRLAGVYRP